MDKLKVLVVGCGNMGFAHAKAYYDIDLSQHLEDAINSLRIVQAADESFRTNNLVRQNYENR